MVFTVGNGLNITGIRSANDFCKIVYFTDAHNQPGMDQSRFVWLARLVNQERPDYLVDGGDFDEWGSVSSHEQNDTQKGKLKPSIIRDLECSAAARKLINDHLEWDCKKHAFDGNHEDRLFRYENFNPEVYGMATGMLADILTAAGWGRTRYGERLTINGVDFTHIPFTKTKPFSGENSAKQIASKAIRDTVFGHIHEISMFTDGKLWNDSVTAFMGGCFMPNKYVPDYAKGTRKEYWYGAHVITIADGRIKSIRSYHIEEMEHLFSTRPARVAVRVKK